jgi:selenium-binding protein 1
METLDLGDQHQMALELRPAHDPTKTYGFVNTVVDVTNLASGVHLWFREDGRWKTRQVLEIPAVALDPSKLPPALQPFGAVPPLVTDIDLSVDDRFLYVSCWGTGEVRQYDVRDPFRPELTGVVEMGGILHRAAHPNGMPIGGGPQMLEISRDGRRVYVTNSLYSAWDDQFYPEGIPGRVVKLDAAPDGGIGMDRAFLVDLGEARAHQVRLQGGDASSDTYCFAYGRAGSRRGRGRPRPAVAGVPSRRRSAATCCSCCIPRWTRTWRTSPWTWPAPCRRRCWAPSTASTRRWAGSSPSSSPSSAAASVRC